MSRGAAAPRGKEKAPAKRRGLGAGSRTRTGDLRITSASLCQLSYASIFSLGEWLRWLDSNQRVRESKSHALPLGYTSIFRGQTLGPSAGVVISTSAPATGFEPVNSTSFWIKKLNPPRLLPA